MHSLIPLSLLLLLFNDPVNALKASLQIRTDVHPSSQLARRTVTTVPLDNKGNAQYLANITLGGTPVRVLLDTGR
jgi:predicted aspartyl protease